MSNLLADIYDEFAKNYSDDRELFDISAILNTFIESLDAQNGKLLDLGCGAGVPVAKLFIDKTWQVTGIDFSREMLALAKLHVPAMKTIHADIMTVDFPANSFDAITAVYSLFHIPKNQHKQLFERLNLWLVPGGKILFTYATKDYTGNEEFDGYKTFMGKQLYYSHNKPEQLLEDLTGSGLKVESMDTREVGGETFLWITAENT